MKIGAAFPSAYLKKEDLGDRHVAVTIERVEIEKVSDDEEKPILYFRGHEKGIVLNRINSDAITEIVGTDETDDWNGHRVVLYVDRNVQMKGKRVGGIRVMAPPRQAQGPVQRPAPPPPPVVEDVTEGFQATDDDVPF